MISRVREGWLVIFTLLTSAVLQLATLGKWSVWHDEGFSALLIDYSYSEILTRTALDVHPPLYYWAVKAWSEVFGTSDVALRSFSVLLTLASIYLAYLILKKLFGSQLARWSLPALAIGPYLVRYAQEIRMYSLAAVFVLAATYLLIKNLEQPVKKRSNWAWVGYSSFMALALYTHYFALFVLATHLVYLIYSNWPNKTIKKRRALVEALKSMPKKWYLSATSAIALFAPWLPIAVDQTNSVQRGFWIADVGVNSFSQLSNQLILLLNSQSWWTRLISWDVFLGLLILTYLAWTTATKKQRPALVMSLGFVVVPAVCLFIISILPFTSVFYHRYFALYAALFYGGLGVAYGIIYASKKYDRFSKNLIGLLLFGFLIVGQIRTQLVGNQHDNGDTFRMKQLSQIVNDQFQPGDGILTNDLWFYFDLRFYNQTTETVRYYERNDLSSGGNKSLIFDRNDIIVRGFEQLKYKQRLWFVTQDDDDGRDFIPDTWRHVRGPYNDGYGAVNLYELR